MVFTDTKMKYMSIFYRFLLFTVLDFAIKFLYVVLEVTEQNMYQKVSCKYGQKCII